jgi:hypothetical protein
MNASRWLLGAFFGVALLVTGLTATAADLFHNEERSRGSAGISLNGIDRASQNEPAEVAGITATAVDLMPLDNGSFSVRGLAALPVD